MAKMSQDIEDKAEAMMGLVHRMATVVLDHPREDREVAFQRCRAIGEESALQSGMSPSAAKEAGEKLEEFTRGLVGIIEAGGAGSGGTA